MYKLRSSHETTTTATIPFSPDQTCLIITCICLHAALFSDATTNKRGNGWRKRRKIMQLWHKQAAVPPSSHTCKSRKGMRQQKPALTLCRVTKKSTSFCRTPKTKAQACGFLEPKRTSGSESSRTSGSESCSLAKGRISLSSDGVMASLSGTALAFAPLLTIQVSPVQRGVKVGNHIF